MRVQIEAIKLLVQQYRDFGGVTNDEGICNKIITPLPPSHNHVIISWESTEMTERTLDNLTTRLDREEEGAKRRNGGEKTIEDKAFFGEINQPALIESPEPSQSNYSSRGNQSIRTKR